MNHLFILLNLLIGFPLIAVGLHLLLTYKKALRNLLQSILSIIWLLLTIIIFFKLKHTVLINLGNWPAPFAINLVFDRLASLMLVVFAIVTVCINFYSYKDKAIKNQETAFYIGFWLLILGITGAICTYDLFNLYVWSEVMLLSAFILLACSERSTNYSLSHYAVINITGTLFMLLAIALIYGLSGSLNYVDIAHFFQHNTNHLALPILCLLLFALGTKGALFPLYFWLPKSYPKPSCSSTMLLSSLVTKAVMIILLRLVYLWLPLQGSFIQTLLIIIAWCTMFFGVMGAASQFRLRDILSFHIISQLGYILLAIVIPSKLAIAAALYFLIHNVFVKTNLFMVAGIFEQHYNTGDLKHLGQLLKENRFLSTVFFISAMSLAGFPPLSGFWAKFLVIKSAVDARFYWSATIAIIVSLFTLYSMIKIWRYAFCEPSAISSQIKNEKLRLPLSHIIALLPLLLIPVLMGLFPDSLLPILNEIANNLAKPEINAQMILGAST